MHILLADRGNWSCGIMERMEIANITTTADFTIADLTDTLKIFNLIVYRKYKKILHSALKVTTYLKCACIN